MSVETAPAAPAMKQQSTNQRAVKTTRRKHTKEVGKEGKKFKKKEKKMWPTPSALCLRLPQTAKKRRKKEREREREIIIK